MSMLDELRKKVLADDDASDEAMALCNRMLGWLAAFEAAHPGLIDKTANCENCGTPAPRYYSDGSTSPMLNPGWAYIWTTPGDKYDPGDFLDPELWFLCPACVEEATP